MPLDLDRGSTGRADDLARDDCSFRICPAADYLERLAAIGRQLGAVDERDIVLKQLGKLVLLFGGGGLPIPAQNKAGDRGYVKILAEQLVKPGDALRRGRALAEDFERAVAEIVDDGGRIRRGGEHGGRKHAHDQRESGRQEKTSRHYQDIPETIRASEVMAAVCGRWPTGTAGLSFRLNEAGGGRFSRCPRISAARRCR